MELGFHLFYLWFIERRSHYFIEFIASNDKVITE